MLKRGDLVFITKDFVFWTVDNPLGTSYISITVKLQIGTSFLIVNKFNDKYVCYIPSKLIFVSVWIGSQGVPSAWGWFANLK